MPFVGSFIKCTPTWPIKKIYPNMPRKEISHQPHNANITRVVKAKSGLRLLLVRCSFSLCSTYLSRALNEAARSTVKSSRNSFVWLTLTINAIGMPKSSKFQLDCILIKLRAESEAHLETPYIMSYLLLWGATKWVAAIKHFHFQPKIKLSCGKVTIKWF